MSDLSFVVLTRLVQVMILMPGARWDQAAFAQAEGVSEDQIQEVLKMLRRAGLADGHLRHADQGLELGSPFAKKAAPAYLAARVEPEVILPGFGRVSAMIDEALKDREQISADELVLVTGLPREELQPYLHLMNHLGMVNAAVRAGRVISNVSRRR